jgi:hypothetical protein
MISNFKSTIAFLCATSAPSVVKDLTYTQLKFPLTARKKRAAPAGVEDDWRRKLPSLSGAAQF